MPSYNSYPYLPLMLAFAGKHIHFGLCPDACPALSYGRLNSHVFFACSATGAQGPPYSAGLVASSLCSTAVLGGADARSTIVPRRGDARTDQLVEIIVLGTPTRDQIRTTMSPNYVNCGCSRIRSTRYVKI